jgi:hypothetical protein
MQIRAHSGESCQYCARYSRAAIGRLPCVCPQRKAIKRERRVCNIGEHRLRRGKPPGVDEAAEHRINFALHLLRVGLERALRASLEEMHLARLGALGMLETAAAQVTGSAERVQVCVPAVTSARDLPRAASVLEANQRQRAACDG